MIPATSIPVQRKWTSRQKARWRRHDSGLTKRICWFRWNRSVCIERCQWETRPSDLNVHSQIMKMARPWRPLGCPPRLTGVGRIHRTLLRLTVSSATTCSGTRSSPIDSRRGTWTGPGRAMIHRVGRVAPRAMLYGSRPTSHPAPRPLDRWCVLATCRFFYTRRRANVWSHEFEAAADVSGFELRSAVPIVAPSSFLPEDRVIHW